MGLVRSSIFLLLGCFAGGALSSTFMEIAESQTNALLAKILEHPFVLSLANGTLKHPNYRYYKKQDRLYNTRYADTLSALSIGTNAISVKNFLTKAAIDSLQYGANGTEVESEQCPSCRAYSDFELSSVLSSFPIGLSAITPCYTVYEQVASWMLQRSVPDNPYQSWIDTWSSEEFRNSTREIRSILNHEASKVDPQVYQRMLRAYTLAVRYEWQFFNSAWNLAKWEPNDE